jgi:DNA modification methylase
MVKIDFVLGDATRLSGIKSNSVDLIIAAPPFIGKDPSVYGGNPKSQINHDSNKMLKLLIKSTKEMQRVLKDTGNIWIEISPDQGLMHRYIAKVLEETDLFNVGTLIHKIKYHEEMFNISKEERYQDWLMWFQLVKDPFNFYRNPFKVKKYEGSFWELELSNKNSLVDIELFKTYPEIFDYTAVKDIPERLIEMFSKPGGLVLDPFGGSGITACEAYKLERNAISLDISPRQKEIAESRFEIEKRIKEGV